MVEVICMWCCLRTTSVPLLLLSYFRPLVFSLALHETVTYLAAKETLLLKVWPTDQAHQLTQQSVRHAESGAPPVPALHFNQLLRKPSL